MIDRRRFMATAGLLAAAPAWARAARPFGPAFRAAVARIEREHGGRLGLAIRDTGSGAQFAWRGAERFPMCSSFKILLAADILQRVERGTERLGRAIPIARADILDHSPFCTPRAGQTATVGELARAAATVSDNCATNLLLRAVGGPAALTRFFRAHGDAVSRIDRTEPELNSSLPGDPRDTTTPVAVLGLLERLALGDALAAASRAQLVGWMLANQTGAAKLRAGLPRAWRIGDRTGAGEHGSNVDLAIAWPPRRPPVLVMAFLTGTAHELEDGNRVHAALGRLIAAALA